MFIQVVIVPLKSAELYSFMRCDKTSFQPSLIWKYWAIIIISFFCSDIIILVPCGASILTIKMAFGFLFQISRMTWIMVWEVFLTFFLLGIISIVLYTLNTKNTTFKLFFLEKRHINKGETKQFHISCLQMHPIGASTFLSNYSTNASSSNTHQQN